MIKYLLLLFAAWAAWGQSNVASITGIVTDPSGAVVPGAEIVVTSRDTGLVYRARTNEAGVTCCPRSSPALTTSKRAPADSSARRSATRYSARESGCAWISPWRSAS